MRGLVALAACLLAGGCSMETAINAMSSEEDRRFAQDLVANVRAGNSAWLEERADPSVQGQLGGPVKEAAALFPAEPGTTRLVGYNVSSSSIAGAGSTRTQEFVLVTEAGGRWIVTELATLARDGGPTRITGWRSTARSERPPELGFYEASERLVPWLWGLGVLFIGVLIAIVWALVRYNRRKRARRA